MKLHTGLFSCLALSLSLSSSPLVSPHSHTSCAKQLLQLICKMQSCSAAFTPFSKPPAVPPFHSINSVLPLTTCNMLLLFEQYPNVADLLLGFSKRFDEYKADLVKRGCETTEKK